MNVPEVITACASVPNAPACVLHPRAKWFAIRPTDGGLSVAVGHVNNVVMVGWIDRVAELASEQFGHARADLLAANRMWFVARHEIDYLGEAFANDALYAATWIEDHRRTSARRATVIWRAKDEQIILRAMTTWVWMDLARRRPTRMSSELTEQIDARLQCDNAKADAT